MSLPGEPPGIEIISMEIVCIERVHPLSIGLSIQTIGGGRLSGFVVGWGCGEEVESLEKKQKKQNKQTYIS